MKKDMHSGLGGGLMAESFRILNDLVGSFENAETGKILIDT